MEKYSLILFVLILPSCATITTRKNYEVEMYSNAFNPKVEILDSTYVLPAKIIVRRSKMDLDLKLISDTLTKNYVVQSSPNASFLYGNLLWMHVSPVAYLLDFTNQKRFYYRKCIYLDINDTSAIIRPRISTFWNDYFSKDFPVNKGQLNFVFSVPYINSFYLQPENELSKSNTGFWGASFGLEYYYQNNKYLSLTANAVSDFFVPVPAAIDISGEYEMMSSLYLSFTDNYKFKRFTVGYGLNYSKNIWDLRYYDRFGPPPPSRDPITRTSESLGFTVTGYHQFGELFFVGLIYRPTFLNVNPQVKFNYEHLISLDFAWKIRIKK